MTESRFLLIAVPMLFLLACQSESPETRAAETPQAAMSINDWFEKQWQNRLTRSPELKTTLGLKDGNDQWDDVSDAFATESHKLLMASLAEMRSTFDYETLSDSEKLSFRLYEYNAELADKRFAFRNHWYVFSQFRGPHSTIPAFLINQHKVDSKNDAAAYVSRLQKLKAYMGQYEANAREQFDNGITLPKWSYSQLIKTSENAISGEPYDDGPPNTLWADFSKKVEALSLEQPDKDALLSDAKTAMFESVKPAYESLVVMFQEHEQRASQDDGAWKFPEGDSYYQVMLEAMTTTSMSPDEIHDLGLAEVARIHEEMTQIKNTVEFSGTLQEFFVYMREDPDKKFTYENTDDGRQAYLIKATQLIMTMRSRLDELFYIKPEADFTVKRVEAFREQAAGKAFYSRPSADGSRPGIYYANLYDMNNMPTYQMEALAYHEGIPGHHMQIAIQQELADIPMFRRFGRVTAYSEGWGLYSELVPKEMGFYSDPYSDFGRLAMELWRAARLVVDSGLHHKKWTREEAIQYLLDNTPNPEGDCVKAIERYIVMPGQATAYKIGMLKILELRGMAQEKLGDQFDIREFHDVILANGPVPLDVLQSLVIDWIESKKVS